MNFIFLLDETGSIEDDCEPLIPYGFFSASFLDWADSSLVLQSNMDCIIDRTRVMDGSVSHKLQGGSGCNSLPPRPSVALNYVRVSFSKNLFLELFFECSFSRH